MLTLNRHLDHLRTAFEERDGYGVWPRLTDIPLERVCDWADAVGYRDSTKARGQMQRALAACLTASTREYTDPGALLFYAMQGLEAFYVTNSESGIGGQFRENLAVFLGSENAVDSKRMKELYDTRSRFVHGQRFLTWQNGAMSYTKGDYKERQRLNEHAKFALRLLVATLQRCIELDASSVGWSVVPDVERVSAIE
ncbi:MAG: hypothetical protein AAFY29_03125 [Pseudomonadota bacterium]